MFSWIPEEAGSWTSISASLPRLEPQHSSLFRAFAHTPLKLIQV